MLSLPKVCICTCLSLVSADYTLTVELKSYQNPSHMRAQSDDCCDGNCSNPCDNRFRFCFSDAPDAAERATVLRSRPEEAVIGCQFATDLVEMDSDDIIFPSSGIFGGNTRNPLTFSGDIWPVRLQSCVIPLYDNGHFYYYVMCSYSITFCLWVLEIIGN